MSLGKGGSAAQVLRPDRSDTARRWAAAPGSRCVPRLHGQARVQPLQARLMLSQVELQLREWRMERPVPAGHGRTARTSSRIGTEPVDLMVASVSV